MPELKSKIVEKDSHRITFYYFGDEDGEKRASDDELIKLYKKIMPSHALLTSAQTIDVVYLSLSNQIYTESGIRTFDHVKIEDNLSKDKYTIIDGNPESAPEWVRTFYNKENNRSIAAKNNAATHGSDGVKVFPIRKKQSASPSSSYSKSSSDDEAEGKSQSRKRTRDNSPKDMGTKDTQKQIEKDKADLRSIKIRINNALADAYQTSNRKDIYNSVIQEHTTTITHGQDYTLSDIETLLKALLNKFTLAWYKTSWFMNEEDISLNNERQNLMTFLAPLMVTHPAILDAECTILNKTNYGKVENDVQEINVKESLLTKQKISSPQEASFVASRPFTNSSSVSIDNSGKRITNNSLRNSTPLPGSNPTEYSQSNSSQVSEKPRNSQAKSFISTSRSISFSQPKSIKQNSHVNKNSGENIQERVGSADKKEQEIGHYHETIITPLTADEKASEFKSEQDTSELSRSQRELENKKKEIASHEFKIHDSISKSGHYAKRKLQSYYDNALKYFKNNDQDKSNNDEEIEELDNKINNHLNLLRFISNEDSNEKFWVLITEENGQSYSDLFKAYGKPLLIKNVDKVYLYGLSTKGGEELIDLKLSIEEQNFIPFPKDHRSEVTNNDLPEIVRNKILFKSVYFNLFDLKHQLLRELTDDIESIDLEVISEEKLDNSFTISEPIRQKIDTFSKNLLDNKEQFEAKRQNYEDLKKKLRNIRSREENNTNVIPHIDEEPDAEQLKKQALAAKNECKILRDEIASTIASKNELIKVLNEEQKRRTLILTALDVCLLAADAKINNFKAELEKLKDWEHVNHVVLTSDYNVSKKFSDLRDQIQKNLAASQKLHESINTNRIKLKDAVIDGRTNDDETIIFVEDRNALLKSSHTAFIDITDKLSADLINDFEKEKKEVENFIEWHNTANNYFKSFGHEAPTDNEKEKLKENVKKDESPNNDLQFPMETTALFVNSAPNTVNVQDILNDLYNKLRIKVQTDVSADQTNPDDLQAAFEKLKEKFENIEPEPTVKKDPSVLRPDIKNEAAADPIDLKNQPKPNEKMSDDEFNALIVSLELDADDDSDKKVPTWAFDTQDKYQNLKSLYSDFKSKEDTVKNTKSDIKKLIEEFRKKEHEFSDSNALKKAFTGLAVNLEIKKTELAANEKAYQKSKTELKDEICKIRNEYGNDDLSLQALINLEAQRLAKLYNRLKSFLEELTKEKYISTLELKDNDLPEKRAAALQDLHSSAKVKLGKTGYATQDFSQPQPKLETREEKNQYCKARYLHVIVQASDPKLEQRRQAYAIANLPPISQTVEKMNAASAGQAGENNDDNQNNYPYSLDHSSIVAKEKPWYEKAWNKFKDFWYEYGGAISTTATLVGGFALVVIGVAIANPIVMLAGGGVILAGGAETLIASWITNTDKGESPKKQPQKLKQDQQGQKVEEQEVQALSTSVIHKVIPRGTGTHTDDVVIRENQQQHQGIQEAPVITQTKTQTHNDNRCSM